MALTAEKQATLDDARTAFNAKVEALGDTYHNDAVKATDAAGRTKVRNDYEDALRAATEEYDAVFETVNAPDEATAAAILAASSANTQVAALATQVEATNTKVDKLADMFAAFLKTQTPAPAPAPAPAVPAAPAAVVTPAAGA